VKDVEIAITGPMMRLVIDGLEQHFIVRAPTDAADQEAFFRAFGQASDVSIQITWGSSGPLMALRLRRGA
jgi:hypothetical protein